MLRGSKTWGVWFKQAHDVFYEADEGQKLKHVGQQKCCFSSFLLADVELYSTPSFDSVSPVILFWPDIVMMIHDYC